MGKQEFSGQVNVTTTSTLISNASLYGTKTVGTAPVEMRIGASPLTNRAIVSLQADPTNTGKIYIGLDNTVSTSKWCFVLTAGSTISIEQDAGKTLNVWAIADTASQIIGLLEGAD